MCMYIHNLLIIFVCFSSSSSLFLLHLVQFRVRRAFIQSSFFSVSVFRSASNILPETYKHMKQYSYHHSRSHLFLYIGLLSPCAFIVYVCFISSLFFYISAFNIISHTNAIGFECVFASGKRL